jgi:hypothetical protein
LSLGENTEPRRIPVDEQGGIRVHRVATLALILGLVSLALAVLAAVWGWNPEPTRWVTETVVIAIWLPVLPVGIVSLKLMSVARRDMKGEDQKTLTLLAFASVTAWLGLGLWTLELLTGLDQGV